MSEKKAPGVRSEKQVPVSAGGARTAKAPPKKPIQLDPQYITRLTVTLLTICLVVALLLGVVNGITKPMIDQAKWEKTVAAMSEVIPADSYEPIEGQTFSDGVSAVYKAVSGAALQGYAVEVSANGFGGAITMVVGVDSEGYVTGVSVISHSETSNIGTKVVASETVLGRFTGMTHADGEITVNKGDNRFDGVSGATFSSKGVTAGVNAALRAVAGLNG